MEVAEKQLDLSTPHATVKDLLGGSLPPIAQALSQLTLGSEW